MKEGVKITHNWFALNEWMTIDKGEILLSCGTRFDYYDFFNSRFQNGWKEGYELFKKKSIMKQSNIEWLFSEIQNYVDADYQFNPKQEEKIVEQAKNNHKQEMIDFASTRIISLFANRKKKSIDLRVYRSANVSLRNTPYFLSVLVKVRETQAINNSLPSSSF
jgi:hypothetical protein